MQLQGYEGDRSPIRCATLKIGKKPTIRIETVKRKQGGTLFCQFAISNYRVTRLFLAGMVALAGLAALGSLAPEIGSAQRDGCWQGNLDLFPNDSLATAGHLRCFSTNYDPDINDAFNNNTSTTVPHATVHGTGDGTVDFYKFTVDKPGTVGVFDIDYGRVDADGSGPDDFDSWIEVRDSNGNVLAVDGEHFPTDSGSETNFFDGTMDSLIEITLGNPGTYYVAVGRWPGLQPLPNGATYTLHVSLGGQLSGPPAPTPTNVTNLDALPWSKDFDPDINDASNANTSTSIPHKSVNGVGSGVVDWYSVTVSGVRWGGTTAIFDIDYGVIFSDGSGPDDFDAWIEVWDANGNLIARDDDQTPVDSGSEIWFGNTTLDSLIEVSLTAPGTYYIAVGRFPNLQPVPAGGTYTLHVSIDELPGRSGR